MKEEYNKLFEKVAPRMSDEELFKSVLSGGKEHSMSKNTTPKKGNKKALLITAVAAAAVAATTVGAATVYNRSINEDYNEILAQVDNGGWHQAYTDKDGNELDRKNEAVEKGLYEKMNIELNKSFEYDGFTLEIPGVVSDGEELLVMYNLVFDEDPFSGDDPWYKKDELIYLFGHNGTEQGVYHGGRAPKSVISIRDGKTVYSGIYDLRIIERPEDDTLKLSFERLCTSSGSKERDIYAEIEIPITDDLKKFNKTVDVPDEPYVELADWGNWDLVQIEAAPLGVTFTLKTDGETPTNEIFKQALVFIPTYVTFKDGSTLDITTGIYGGDIDCENKTMALKWMFNYPVEVDDIQSIQFASALVNMEDGSSTTVEVPEMRVLS